MKLFVVLVIIVAGASVEGRPQWFPQLPFSTVENKDAFGSKSGRNQLKIVVGVAANVTKRVHDTAQTVEKGIDRGIDWTGEAIKNRLNNVVDNTMHAIQMTSGSTTTGTGSLGTSRAAFSGSSISADSNTDVGTVVDTRVPISDIAPSTGTTKTGIIEFSAAGIKKINEMSTGIGASVAKKSIRSYTAEPMLAVKVTDMVLDTVNTMVQSGNVNKSAITKAVSERISHEIPAIFGISSEGNGKDVIANLQLKLYEFLNEQLENVSGENMETFIEKMVAVIVDVVCDIGAALTNTSQSSFTSTSSSASSADITRDASSSNGGSFSLTM